jgi:hypothetical protein
MVICMGGWITASEGRICMCNRRLTWLCHRLRGNNSHQSSFPTLLGHTSEPSPHLTSPHLMYLALCTSPYLAALLHPHDTTAPQYIQLSAPPLSALRSLQTLRSPLSALHRHSPNSDTSSTTMSPRSGCPSVIEERGHQQ